MSTYHLSFTARITNYEANNPSDRYGFSVSISNGSTGVYLGLSPNGLETPNGPTFGYDVSGWHTYELVGQAGNNWQFLYDGVLQQNGLATFLSSTNEIAFGDGSSGANSNVDISAFSFQAPEPCLRSLLQSL